MAATEPDNTIDAIVDFFGASNLAEVASGFDSATVDAYTAAGSPIPAYILGPGRACHRVVDFLHTHLS